MITIRAIQQWVYSVQEDLSSIHNNYCIIGSGAVLLSGIKTKVKDIDILTTAENAEKLKAKWNMLLNQSYVPEMPERFRSNFGRFTFPQLDVEVMGDLQVFRDKTWLDVRCKDFMTIDLMGVTVNIPTPEEQIRIYKLLGRDKDLNRIKLIEAQLRNSPGRRT